MSPATNRSSVAVPDDLSFVLDEEIAGVAALGADFAVLRRAGRLSQWLPEVGHSCFESDLLCGLEADLFGQQTGQQAEALSLPEMRVMFGDMVEKITILIRWDKARQIYVVLTTRDQMARPIDEWMARRAREQRILEERIAEANREIAIRELRYQDVVDNNPDLICRFDGAGCVSFVNVALAQFLGRSSAEILGQNLIELFEIEEGEAFWRHLERPEANLVQMRRQSGLHWIMWSARRLSGEQAEWQAVGRDVTALKLLEATISNQRDALEQANRELSLSNTHLKQFSSIAAHDLQAPLRQTAAFARLLRENYATKLDEDGAEFIESMLASLTRSQKMVSSLLKYARLSSSAFDFEKVDVTALVHSACAALADMIGESGAEVHIGDLPMMYGDAVLVGQLWQNLLANSLKYRADRPLVVRISGFRDDAFVNYAVEDNGRGVNPEQAEAIFHMFRRAESSTGVEGTGIGLSLARRIAEIHNGQISLDASYGPGCRFVIRMPA